MSNGLVLPFDGAVTTATMAFEIDSAGSAIFGLSDPRVGTRYFDFLIIPSGVGVWGMSSQGDGVRGDDSSAGFDMIRTEDDFSVIPKVGPDADRPAGVYGTSFNNYGVYGSSANYDGVKGVSQSPEHAGVSAINTSAGIGVYATGGNLAAQFDGTVQANGDIKVTGDVTFVNASGGDCAEDFDIEDGEENITPGTVLVIGDHGKLTVTREGYDSRIAGVVSGAGSLRPAILLNRVSSAQRRMPIALIGRAYCKVDATFARIKPGDLLTTSPTPGYAMKVLDRAKTAGALLGKALEGLENGRGLIPILVSPR
jgi:hypothetical protein